MPPNSVETAALYRKIQEENGYYIVDDMLIVTARVMVRMTAGWACPLGPN
jgi:hypothetical protein